VRSWLTGDVTVLNILSGSAQQQQQQVECEDESSAAAADDNITFTVLSKKGNKQQVIDSSCLSVSHSYHRLCLPLIC